MGFGGGNGRLATLADLSFSASSAFFLALMDLYGTKMSCCAIYCDYMKTEDVTLTGFASHSVEASAI